MQETINAWHELRQYTFKGQGAFPQKAINQANIHFLTHGFYNKN